MAEQKRQRREVFVPLTYRPGDLAEVDFFEVLVDLDGTRRKAWLLLMRLMYSGRDFAWIYERQDQISFLDGHVRAFAHFGGALCRIVDQDGQGRWASSGEWARQGPRIVASTMPLRASVRGSRGRDPGGLSELRSYGHTGKNPGEEPGADRRDEDHEQLKQIGWHRGLLLSLCLRAG